MPLLLPNQRVLMTDQHRVKQPVHDGFDVFFRGRKQLAGRKRLFLCILFTHCYQIVEINIRVRWHQRQLAFICDICRQFDLRKRCCDGFAIMVDLENNITHRDTRFYYGSITDMAQEIFVFSVLISFSNTCVGEFCR